MEFQLLIKPRGLILLSIPSGVDFIEHTFNRPPAASPALTVGFSLDTENFANCSSPVTNQNLVVPSRDNINIGFTATPISQSLPASTVTISNTTTPGPWSYLWDFGDGTTSVNANVTSHTYATYGVYTIRLTVTNNVCVETQAQQVEILAIPPIVDFSYDPPEGCMPLRVSFTNLSQFADPNSYQWDFGDGATSQAINPTQQHHKPLIQRILTFNQVYILFRYRPLILPGRQ